MSDGKKLSIVYKKANTVIFRKEMPIYHVNFFEI